MHCGPLSWAELCCTPAKVSLSSFANKLSNWCFYRLLNERSWITLPWTKREHCFFSFFEFARQETNVRFVKLAKRNIGSTFTNCWRRRWMLLSPKTNAIREFYSLTAFVTPSSSHRWDMQFATWERRRLVCVRSAWAMWRFDGNRRWKS